MKGASNVAHRFSRRMNVSALYRCTCRGGAEFVAQSDAPSFQRTSIDPGTSCDWADEAVSSIPRASRVQSTGRTETV